MSQKVIQNRSENALVSCIALGLDFSMTLSCFGESHIAFWAYPPMKNNGFQKTHLLSQIAFYVQNDFIFVSKSVQNGLENHQKTWSEKCLEKTYFLSSKMTPKWVQNRSKMTPKWVQKCPRAVQGRPRAPKSVPRAPRRSKWHQNEYKMTSESIENLVKFTKIRFNIKENH